MSNQSRSEISNEDATKDFGVKTHHEDMGDGEKRFRLDAGKHGSYILTTRETAGWQKSHFHEHCAETYVVQDKWLLFVQGGPNEYLSTYVPAGRSITTSPKVCHNIYLPSGAVIHTVKHGRIADDDWHPCPELDSELSTKTQEDLIAMSACGERKDHFSDYMSLYNNLDNLLWKIPGFLLAISAIIFGLLGNLINDDGSIPHNAYLVLFSATFVVIMLNFAGIYSLLRIRYHHDEAGRHLAIDDYYGYFTKRLGRQKEEGFLKSAPGVIVLIMLTINTIALTLDFIFLELFIYPSRDPGAYDFTAAATSSIFISSLVWKAIENTKLGITKLHACWPILAFTITVIACVALELNAPL